MDFRSAKSMPKIRHLLSEGLEKAKSAHGRRIGRGPSEGQESAEVGRSIRHASGTPLCETGAADPNAPSGASTAAPYFGARRLVQLMAI